MSFHIFNQGPSSERPNIRTETLLPGKSPEGIVAEKLSEICAAAVVSERQSQGQVAVETCDLAAELWGVPSGLWQRLCTPGDLLVIQPGEVPAEILMGGAAGLLGDAIARLWAAYRAGLLPLSARWLVALQSVNNVAVSLLRELGLPIVRKQAGQELPLVELLEVIRYTALMRWAADASLTSARAERETPKAETPDAPPTQADE